MRKDIQKKINTMFNQFPKNCFEDIYGIVEIDEHNLFGKVKDILKLLEDWSKTYDVEKTKEEIRKMEFKDLADCEEVGYQDKIKTIDELNKKIKNKELNENDVIYLKIDHMADYVYIIGKKQTLTKIKKTLGEIMEDEMET